MSPKGAIPDRTYFLTNFHGRILWIFEIISKSVKK